MVLGGSVYATFPIQCHSQVSQQRNIACRSHGPMLGHGSILGLLWFLTRPWCLCDGFNPCRHKLCRAHRACSGSGKRPLWCSVLHLCGYDGATSSDFRLLVTHSHSIGYRHHWHDNFRHIRYACNRANTKSGYAIGLLSHSNRRICIHYRIARYESWSTRQHNLPYCGCSVGYHHVHHSLLHQNGRTGI